MESYVKSLCCSVILSVHMMRRVWLRLGQHRLGQGRGEGGVLFGWNIEPIFFCIKKLWSDKRWILD